MGGCLSSRAAGGAAVDRDVGAARAATARHGGTKGASPGPSSLALSNVYGFDRSVASSSYDFDYAAYAASLLARGGSVGGSSESRRRRFRRHRDRPPHTRGGSSGSLTEGGGGGGCSSSPVGGSSSFSDRGPCLSSKPPNNKPQPLSSPFGPRPDVTRPLAESLLGRSNPDDIAALYQATGVVLGRGQFGVAREATCVQTGERVAVKTIPKRRLKGIDRALVDVRREVEVLRHLSPHPRIVRLIDALEDDGAVHLVLELCEGGELVDAVAAEGRFTERDAAAAMRALLEAVSYCHELGVAHRDLKLDNLLIGSSSSSSPSASASRTTSGGVVADGGTPPPAPLLERCASIKANDFGLASFVKDGERVHDLCGTAFYVAPEVLECSSGGGKKGSKGYDAKAADIWACGVILYIMLSGVPPFFAEKDEDVFRQILQGGEDGQGPCFGDRVWDCVSIPAIECVQRMMQRDPKRRPTAAELLRDDPWIREGGVASDDRPLQPEVIKRMRAFAKHNRLRREAMLLVAEAMPPEEIAGLRTLFESFDTDHDGTVTAEELREGLMRQGHGAVPAEALERVIALADVNNDAKLDVDEFIASTLDICRAGLRQRLEAAFARFDRDGDGSLTRDEVGEALAALHGRRKRREAARSRRGTASTSSADHADDDEASLDASLDDDAALAGELTRAERAILSTDVEAIFAEVDADGDGCISREEFFAMMERPLNEAEGDLFGLDASGGAGAADFGASVGVGRGINRRSLAAAMRAVEQDQKQQKQQKQGVDSASPPVRAHA
jgi:calcium-dependent protein kinase